MLFKSRIQNALKKEEAVKANAKFCGKFMLQKADRVIEESKYFNTKNAAIYRDIDFTQWFEINVIEPIVNDLDNFNDKDSGWMLKVIINLGVNVNKFRPQLGSSYVELPESIKNKQACVNVKNQDNLCFTWAVTSALYPIEWRNHPNRKTFYLHSSSVLNLEGLNFPMSLKQIPKRYIN